MVTQYNRWDEIVASINGGLSQHECRQKELEKLRRQQELDDLRDEAQSVHRYIEPGTYIEEVQERFRPSIDPIVITEEMLEFARYEVIGEHARVSGEAAARWVDMDFIEPSYVINPADNPIPIGTIDEAMEVWNEVLHAHPRDNIVKLPTDLSGAA